MTKTADENEIQQICLSIKCGRPTSVCI